MQSKTSIINKLTIVSGPINSGKSRWAEELLKDQSIVTYIATGKPANADIEWASKIREHIQRRQKTWSTIESQGNLHTDIINSSDAKNIIIDSLGGFVTANIAKDKIDWFSIKQSFLHSIEHYKGNLIVVVEETGWSVVPSTQVGTLFRNRLSELALELQSIAHSIWLVVLGRAINIKDLGLEVPMDE